MKNGLFTHTNRQLGSHDLTLMNGQAVLGDHDAVIKSVRDVALPSLVFEVKGVCTENVARQ